MKLKTLKDLEIRRPRGDELPYLDMFKEKLKVEAVKWIKENLSKNKGQNVFVIAWIEHFFNLTDKDLNEVEDK